MILKHFKILNKISNKFIKVETIIYYYFNVGVFYIGMWYGVGEVKCL